MVIFIVHAFVLCSEVIKKGVYCLGRKWGVISTLKSSSPKVDEEDPLDALYKKTVVSMIMHLFTPWLPKLTFFP